MAVGKWETNEDVKITFEGQQNKETKVEDKSINFRWKVKTKVCHTIRNAFT